MGIAQRLTVVKQHDTEPARDHLWGWSAPNSRSHGLPDTPQALRWGGVPAAKHPRKIAHHGPEPKSSTPFPTNGQVFSMRSSGGICAHGRAPSPHAALGMPRCCFMVDARAHAPLGHVAPAYSRRGRMARAGSRRRCAQLGTSGSRGTPIRRPRKAYIWYDVPTASSTSPAPLRLPPATPPRHAPHRATWHAPRHASFLAPALRSPRPATPKPSAAQNAHPALGHFVTTKTTRLRHHARPGCSEDARPLTGSGPKCSPFAFNA